ncbi:flagellar biosynthesis protein FlhB [Paenibacillus albiflavus]|uniref:Flagellar biosynthetic protein FlhB n=1 Tax=Paenibacillus albiflavus TaxID=2545760 RepID=A0A4R4EIJ9_9BACL|nr:flagellar biosynthesis protein FlhB [Paenibacillus albiflavus]TCZ79976.1 flagellar biosynthesis protein FlhB [Paenibacillus albiflavus]
MSRYFVKVDLQLFSQEKTEEATPKKKQESREKGQVAKSMELPAAFILFFTFLFFILFGGFMKERFMSLISGIFENNLLMDLTEGNVRPFFTNLIFQAAIILAPIMLMAMVIGIVGNIMQFGFLFTTEPLKMKLSNLSPLKGFKRIFSMRSLVECLKSIIKILIIGLVVYSTIWGQIDEIVKLGRVPLTDVFSVVADITLSLGIKIGGMLIVIAFIDFMYQKYEYNKNLRMSKQDIKDEYKKSEGDPLIKGKIKEKQRRMAMMRMMQDIPKADVIITNPTHYAVALKYDDKQMEAPTVIAKGTDFVALKIREKAKEHGIAVMENRPLARALYAQVEIGKSIPADLFQAVAEVLAFVYKTKGKKR